MACAVWKNALFVADIQKVSGPFARKLATITATCYRYTLARCAAIPSLSLSYYSHAIHQPTIKLAQPFALRFSNRTKLRGANAFWCTPIWTYNAPRFSWTTPLYCSNQTHLDIWKVFHNGS
jgi:hypothetical protein